MGDLWIQIVARSAGDAAVLADDIRRKSHAEDLAAYVKLLREDPGNPLRHDAVGNLYLEDARYDDAIAEYRASLLLNADSAPTHYNLGFALSMRGRRAQALAGIAWIRATAADPSLRNSEQAVTFAERAAAATARRDLPVLDALAAAYASAGRYDDAVATVERGINLATAGGLDAA